MLDHRTPKLRSEFDNTILAMAVRQGIYAADSVGKLTHPATSTHTHVIYTDPKTGIRVTGHVEQIGLAKGAVLKIPARDNRSDNDKPE
ncbi:MAG: hypothetical protein R3C19_16180 [Planctomycetaceae bacterium]